MKDQKTNTPEQPFRKSVAFVLVFYWAVLVAWQNISGAETRSNADLMVKMGLLLYFSWFYLKRARFVSGKILWVLLLAMSLMVTAFTETEFPLSSVIAYVYPVAFLTMVYGLGDNYEITRVQLITFCNWIIGITLYAAVYAIIFCREQFVGFLSVSNAYGNELFSFFSSCHEYGMYLACAMISCGLCLKYEVQMTRARKAYYIAVLVVFALNLILTFSRTAMAGMAVFLLLFIITGKGGLRRWVLTILFLLSLVILLSPSVSEFVFRIILKKNNLAGRDVLFDAGLRYYRDGMFMNRTFGFGIQGTRIGFGNRSVHNAYLQILLYYGAVGLAFLLAFLVSQLWKSIKMIRKDRFWGAVSLGLTGMAMLMMFTNTQIIFTSPIDCYFMTMYMFVVPKYVGNAVRKDKFD